MTTKLKEADVGLPVRDAELRAPIRYQDDLYGWSLEQARLLRDGRFPDLDLINLADEIADVGNEQYDKLEGALRVLLQHLLKWDHQPELRSRSWVNSINEQRRRVNRVLRKNPNLKSSFDEAVTEAYEDARGGASSETDIKLGSFPTICPYAQIEFMDRLIEWPDDR